MMLKKILLSVGLLCALNSLAQDLKIVPFDAKQLPSEIKTKGKVVKVVKFIDILGENLLVLTNTEPVHSLPKGSEAYDIYVYGHRFVKKNGKFEQLWMIQDWVKECDLDYYCEFILPSVTVTDLNQNGLAETSFLYKTACRGDVSPAVLKLIMHEGATKYALRGRTLYVGEGGERTIDASFTKADKRLLDFAKKQWEKYKTENP